MLTYVIRRLLYSVVVLFAASFIIFFFVSVSNDPLSFLKMQPTASEQTIANINVRSHTFNVIGPHMTDEFKMPNSCTACHTDKSTDWIRTAMRSWPNVSPWRVQ